MSIQIAQFQGISPVSVTIKVLTYSIYSHTAARFTEDLEVSVDGKTHFIAAGNVIEAWKGGVKLSSSLSERHEPGTKVDLFETKTPLTREQERKVAEYLIRNIGKKYAYWNVARFVPVVRALIPKPLPMGYNRTHVFCSELVLEAFAYGGVPLLVRCSYWEVPPRDPPRSPVVMPAGKEITD